MAKRIGSSARSERGVNMGGRKKNLTSLPVDEVEIVSTPEGQVNVEDGSREGRGNNNGQEIMTMQAMIQKYNQMQGR